MVQFHFFESSTDIRSDDPAERIKRRFINYLISFPFARAEHENEDGTVDEALKESAEEAKRRRMLEIERLRHQERQRKAQSKQRFQDRLSEELHEDIYDRILTAIDDADELKQSIIVMPETLPELIDTVNMRAGSMARIEKLTTSLSWLHKGILRVVNNPPFSTRRKESEIRVENYRLAMGYVGSENLRTLVPAFALQNWLPYSTKPFSMFRRKIWDHSTATANIAFEIAVHEQLKMPSMAYALGMFHELGKVALMKLYLKHFDQVQQQQMIKTVNDRSPERHNAIRMLQPDEQFLRDLMLENDKRVSQIVVAGWELKRVPLSEHLLSFVTNNSVAEMTDYARVLSQASAYSTYRMLKEIGMVESEEAQHWLSNHGFTKQQLLYLRNVPLKSMRVSVP